MIKIRDIAQLSGYSISTVSRVLNNKGDFSKETVDKIHQVIDSLNYKPKNSESIRSNTSYTIGLFIPEKDAFISNDPAMSNDLPNLQEEIEKKGHSVKLITNPLLFSSQALAYRVITDKKVDAAIVVGPYSGDNIVQLLIENNIPYLVTNGRDFGSSWNYIDYDNYGGAFEVIHYLNSLGHKNIGIISGPPNHLVNVNRLDGCKAAFNDLKSDLYCYESGSFSFETGYESTKKLMSASKKPSAIFAFSDIIALGAIKAMSDMNLHVPQVVPIVGFDDIDMAQYSIPSLTTVRRFKYDIYQLVASSIIDLIENRNIKNLCITLKTELIFRDSCKPLK